MTAKSFRFYCVDRDTAQVLGTNSADVAREYINRFDYVVVDLLEGVVKLPDGHTECIFQTVEIENVIQVHSLGQV